MAHLIKTESISKGIANTNWVVLEETPDTALVFKPQVHEGGVRGLLVRYKKNADDEWKELAREDFRKLNLHDGVFIQLRTESINRLCEAVNERRSLKDQDFDKGRNKYIVGKEEEVLVISDQNIKQAVEQILLKGITEKFWEELKNIDFKEASRLSRLLIKSERETSLEEFRESIVNSSKDENYWQDFFEKNKWIFGYGLNYKILRQEQTQPNYGGTRVDGTGGQRGDTLTSTAGEISFTVLVEIKKSVTPLLQGTQSQRNGAWSLSRDLGDGITQLQANESTWEIRGSTEPDNRDRLEDKDIFTVKPKGILVIGRLNELNTRDKKNTFERFRQSLHGVDVITFDELLKRAEFIVEGLV